LAKFEQLKVRVLAEHAKYTFNETSGKLQFQEEGGSFTEIQAAKVAEKLNSELTSLQKEHAKLKRAARERGKAQHDLHHAQTVQQAYDTLSATFSERIETLRQRYTAVTFTTEPAPPMSVAGKMEKISPDDRVTDFQPPQPTDWHTPLPNADVAAYTFTAELNGIFPERSYFRLYSTDSDSDDEQ
tara:strand:- start:423 stop:977 length:555 start_codon:yes stop_codon:yes gene_type:complete